MLKTAILAAILHLPEASYPVGMEPETKEERSERLEVVASAIADVVEESTCSRPSDSKAAEDSGATCVPVWPKDAQQELASMLVTLAWYESKFVRRVHEGKCFVNECDALRLPGGKVIHRSRTLWQIQRNPRIVSRMEWEGMVGASLESTRTAARVATRILASSRNRCARHTPDRWLEPTIAAYATGFSCSWSKASTRATTYKKVLGVIER